MQNDHFYCLDSPLAAKLSRTQMRAANFVGLPELVRKRGADLRSILEKHGVQLANVLDPDYCIECRSYVDVVEDCSVLLDDPLLGLHLAQTQQVDEVYGCVTAVCRAAPTFRQTVMALIDYIPVAHAPMTTLQLVEGREVAELRWSVNTDLGHNLQANYQSVLLNLKLFRQVVGPSFKPSYVNIAASVSSRGLSFIEQAFGCPFRSDTKITAIAFPVALLRQSVASANRIVFELVSGYLNRVKASDRTSLVDRVRDYVFGSLSSGNCTAEDCARKLGISVRTLHLHLKTSGLNFSDIVELQRMDRAKSFLSMDHMNLSEITEALGYSEHSSFGRAFKRWTGVSPRAYRARLLQSAA